MVSYSTWHETNLNSIPSRLTPSGSGQKQALDSFWQKRQPLVCNFQQNVPCQSSKKWKKNVVVGTDILLIFHVKRMLEGEREKGIKNKQQFLMILPWTMWYNTNSITLCSYWRNDWCWMKTMQCIIRHVTQLNHKLSTKFKGSKIFKWKPQSISWLWHHLVSTISFCLHVSVWSQALVPALSHGLWVTLTT